MLETPGSSKCVTTPILRRNAFSIPEMLDTLATEIPRHSSVEAD